MMNVCVKSIVNVGTKFWFQYCGEKKMVFVNVAFT